jgi:hypothetical protein
VGGPRPRGGHSVDQRQAGQLRAGPQVGGHNISKVLGSILASTTQKALNLSD